MKHHHDIEKINRNNFRNCLEAMARPGQRQEITPLFGSSLLAMASVFLYAEVSHYYKSELDFELIGAICGSPLAPQEQADYLFLDTPLFETVAAAKIGTSENPEESATLIFSYTRDQLRSGTAAVLEGPGISGRSAVELPVDSIFLQELSRKNSDFPLGVDLFFIGSDDSLIGLPRTTRIEVAQ